MTVSGPHGDCEFVIEIRDLFAKVFDRELV
jgi:hypothetical protein